ncbi:hypothetical protein [Oceanithermus sp.]
MNGEADWQMRRLGAEVAEKARGLAGVVLVVARDGQGAFAKAARRGVVATREMARRACRVGQVAERGHPARVGCAQALEQRSRGLVSGPVAAGDVARGPEDRFVLREGG